ncbi:hypothetical protein OA007_02110 [SAR116 cluster bacterium]|nr:hypothetical protein [SAR116 cluster bacterium]
MAKKLKNLAVVTPVYLEAEPVLKSNIVSVQSAKSLQVQTKHVLIQDGVCNLSHFLPHPNPNFVGQCITTRFNHDDYGDYVRRLGTKIALKRSMVAVTFLDGDNAWEHDHIRSICETRERTGKNIIISGRRLLTDHGRIAEKFDKSFFDTNTIALFGDAMKVGLLWGRYPREMSLIGDRIISQYIKTHFPNQIAYTNKATVLYRYSKIPTHKVNTFKSWYEAHYSTIASEFRNRFGFDVRI